VAPARLGVAPMLQPAGRFGAIAVYELARRPATLGSGVGAH
jgi:hypothetical protein